MSGGRLRHVLTVVSSIAFALPATAQSVVAARSGVVHFFEGTVHVGDQKLEPQLGRFPIIPEGSEIRTEQGRAEILLTPGVFLRIGENSAVRMLTTHLEDTRVELVNGSAAIDCTQNGPGTSLTLTLRQWQTHFVTKGLYRLDSAPPTLWVRTGVAEVRAGNDAPVTVERGMRLPFAPVLVPERSTEEPEDGLSDWAIGRRQSVLADDAVAAQIDEDPASRGDVGYGIAGVSNFPLIGLPSVDPGYYGGIYDSYYSRRQPGFSSIYMPGYWGGPLMLFGLRGASYRTGVNASAFPAGGYHAPQTGFPPAVRYHVPTAPPAHAPAVHPAVVPMHPVTSAPHSVGHVSVGRAR